MAQEDRNQGLDLNRRGFLALAGTGAASLVGTSALTPRGWSRPPAVNGDNTVTIRTHEHFGDIEEQLTFPSTWELEVQQMQGHGRPGLTTEQVRERLNRPIDTPPLREIAAGKKTAVITFDDLTRPTPIQAVLPLLVEELRAAGLKDENIIFLTSYGTHRALTHSEARAKLGSWVVDNFAWLNHNIWENVVEVGVTSHGNKIKLNYHFVHADVRITVSGIKPHGTAGYGGGGKAVLPGVAWVESIDFFHRTITGLGTNPTVGTAKVFENDVRKDMEEAARLAQVQFSVQIVYNERREPAEIFAGDVVAAHHAACRMANGYLRTSTAQNADIVVMNAYPQSRQASSSLRWARRSLRDGGSAVLIAQHPDAMSTLHYLHERWDYEGHPYWEVMESDNKPVDQAAQLIVLSQYMQKRDVNRISARHVHLARSWDDVLELLETHHRTEARVAVYPYAAIQHRELELT
jgi:nickel-dependent lactate racemase